MCLPPSEEAISLIRGNYYVLRLPLVYQKQGGPPLQPVIKDKYTVKDGSLMAGFIKISNITRG